MTVTDARRKVASRPTGRVRRICSGGMRGEGPLDEIIDRYESDLAALKTEPVVAST